MRIYPPYAPADRPRDIGRGSSSGRCDQKSRSGVFLISRVPFVEASGDSYPLRTFLDISCRLDETWNRTVDRYTTLRNARGKIQKSHNIALLKTIM